MIHREHLTIETRGRGTYELTRQVQQAVERSKVSRALPLVHPPHERVADRLRECRSDRSPRSGTVRCQSGARRRSIFQHDSEGPDDMPAHIRSILTLTSLTIPVESRRCDLGTWQGVFLWEHRTSPHRRRITVSITGERMSNA